MASSVWISTVEDAYSNPYAHEAQETFLKEAERVLGGIQKLLNGLNMKFHRDDRSAEKAVWMLQFDVLDALFDAIFLLRNARPNAAGRVFRDVIETLDLAAHFTRASTTSKNDLAKWYDDRVVQHKRSRESAGLEHGQDVEKTMASEYQSFSRFTHRTYRVLLQSYGIGDGDLIWNDNLLREHDHPLPQTVSQYLAILAGLILRFVDKTKNRVGIDPAAVDH